MRAKLDQSDTQFLGRLHRLGASSVQELCAEMGVTATAIRQRIARLQSAGYVDRETVRAPRGRPYHVYRVTSEGARQLGDDYSEFAQILWKELRGIQDQDIRNRLLDRIRQSLVERYRPDTEADSVVGRFEQLKAGLDRQGFEVEVETRTADEGLLPILREHYCPYHDLAAEDSSICDLEQSVFEDVLGVPVKLTQCCRDGDSCCEFEAVATG